MQTTFNGVEERYAQTCTNISRSADSRWTVLLTHSAQAERHSVRQTWARDVSAVSSGTALSAKRLALDWSAALHTEAVGVPVERTSLEDADAWDDIMLSSEAVSTGRSSGGVQRTEAWHLCEAVQHNTDDVASNRSGGAPKTTGRNFALVWGDAAMSWARRCTTLYTKVVGFGAAWR
ncbi:hypothetical protein PI124_g9927 [Phytophthora idaei]|nr:hypothetical protein PI124_g9927 [Phytophthora idaei]